MWSMEISCTPEELGTDNPTDMALVIDRLPSEWQGLFTTLQDPLRSASDVELWYRYKHGSQYGTAPTWPTLLESLTAEEPVVTQNGNLTFVRRLALLSPGVQRAFLTFLLRHLDQITNSVVSNFVAKLQSITDKDPWMTFLMKQLTFSLSSECIEMLKFGTIEHNDTSRFNYSFSSRDSRSLLSQLNHEVIAKQDDPDCTKLPWQHQYNFHITEKVLRNTDLCIEPSADDNQVVSAVSPTTTEEKSTDDHSQDVIIISSPVKDEHSEQTDEPMDTSSGQTIEEPAPKRLKSTHLNVSSNVSFSQAEMSFTQMTQEALDSDDLVLVEKLKDVWQTANDDTAIPEEVNLFLTCSASQVQKVCALLELESLDEVSMATVCNHVCSLGDQLSHHNCVSFLRLTIFPKVSDLTHNASRILYSVLTKLSQQFPRPLIEAVIVPCAHQQDAGQPQRELFCKLMKESLNAASRLYLLQNLVECCLSLSNVMLSLIHMLVDLKVDVDKTVMTKIIVLLENSALPHSDNLKFGKFLLAFVTKYGKQLDAEHIESLNRAIAGNKTFMKKPVTAALTKLSRGK